MSLKPEGKTSIYDVPVSEGGKVRPETKMSTLNKYACETLLENNISVHACTDVTGFGLMGHLREMIKGTREHINNSVTALIHSKQVPLLDQTYELVAKNVIPGGTKTNMENVQSAISFDGGVDSIVKVLLCDAQTSG